MSDKMSVENAVFSKITSQATREKLLKIARKYDLSENDPSWLFAEILIANSEISDFAADASKIAADEAQRAVMQKFSDSADQVAGETKTALAASVRDFRQQLQSVVDDVRAQKTGFRKSVVISSVAIAVFFAVAGYFLGSNSQLRLKNNEIFERAQRYDILLEKINSLSERDQKIITDLIFKKK